MRSPQDHSMFPPHRSEPANIQPFPVLPPNSSLLTPSRQLLPTPTPSPLVNQPITSIPILPTLASIPSQQHSLRTNTNHYTPLIATPPTMSTKAHTRPNSTIPHSSHPFPQTDLNSNILINTHTPIQPSFVGRTSTTQSPNHIILTPTKLDMSKLDVKPQLAPHQPLQDPRRYTDKINRLRTPGLMVIIDVSNYEMEGIQQEAALPPLHQTQSPSYTRLLDLVSIQVTIAPRHIVSAHAVVPHNVTSPSMAGLSATSPPLNTHITEGAVNPTIVRLMTQEFEGVNLLKVATTRTFCLIAPGAEYVDVVRHARYAGCDVELWLWVNAQSVLEVWAAEALSQHDVTGVTGALRIYDLRAHLPYLNETEELCQVIPVPLFQQIGHSKMLLEPTDPTVIDSKLDVSFPGTPVCSMAIPSATLHARQEFFSQSIAGSAMLPTVLTPPRLSASHSPFMPQRSRGSSSTSSPFGPSLASFRPSSSGDQGQIQQNLSYSALPPLKPRASDSFFQSPSNNVSDKIAEDAIMRAVLKSSRKMSGKTAVKMGMPKSPSMADDPDNTPAFDMKELPVHLDSTLGYDANLPVDLLRTSDTPPPTHNASANDSPIGNEASDSPMTSLSCLPRLPPPLPMSVSYDSGEVGNVHMGGGLNGGTAGMPSGGSYATVAKRHRNLKQDWRKQLAKAGALVPCMVGNEALNGLPDNGGVARGNDEAGGPGQQAEGCEAANITVNGRDGQTQAAVTAVCSQTEARGRCTYREFCNRRQCNGGHTSGELTYFSRWGGRAKYCLGKQKMCARGSTCDGRKRRSGVCSFLHKGELPFCAACLGSHADGACDYERDKPISDGDASTLVNLGCLVPVNAR